MIDDLWYKNSVIYSLDVDAFMDADGDGVGDFDGLVRRLDYLHSLGVDTIWLAPFQPTPNRDNGYDIADYYGVDPRHGSAGNFVEFMQQAGFSITEQLASPVIDTGVYSYDRVNVELQRRNSHSLLNWTSRMIRLRHECPEISWGTWEILPTNVPQMLAMRYDWRGSSLVTVHNFDDKAHEVQITPNVPHGEKLISLIQEEQSEADANGVHYIALDAYDYRWYQIGDMNYALHRTS